MKAIKKIATYQTPPENIKNLCECVCLVLHTLVQMRHKKKTSFNRVSTADSRRRGATRKQNALAIRERDASVRKSSSLPHKRLRSLHFYVSQRVWNSCFIKRIFIIESTNTLYSVYFTEGEYNPFFWNMKYTSYISIFIVLQTIISKR